MEDKTIPLEFVQILHTIQGEGIFLGKPCILLRLKRCNLNCPFCDTSNILHNSPTLVINSNSILSQFICRLEKFVYKYNISHLMITGGEPFVYLQNNSLLLTLIKYCTEIFSTVEIETNGTLLPKEIDNVYKLVYFTVSPKYMVLRDNNRFYNNILCLHNISKDITIKLLHSSELERDLDNFIHGLYGYIDSKTIKNKIVIMPLTPNTYTYEELANVCRDTVNYCIKHGLRYCPREHLFLWPNIVNEAGDVNLWKL